MTELHLTDEHLSSHLDGTGYGSGVEPEFGAGRPAVDEHLHTCDACRDRLAGLEMVRELVRQPVPQVSADIRATAVAKALREGRVDTVDGVDHLGGRREPSEVIRRSRRVRPRVFAGVAAALVVAGGIGAALAFGGLSTPTASNGPARSVAPTGKASSMDRHASSGSASVFGFGGDLGAIDSPLQLQHRLSPLKDGLYRNSASSNAGSPAVGSGGFSTQVPVARPAGIASAQVARCLPGAVNAASGNRTLELAATASYRGAPAVAFLFGPVAGATQGPAARSLAVVTAAAGCHVLVTASV